MFTILLALMISAPVQEQEQELPTTYTAEAEMHPREITRELCGENVGPDQWELIPRMEANWFVRGFDGMGLVRAGETVRIPRDLCSVTAPSSLTLADVQAEVAEALEGSGFVSRDEARTIARAEAQSMRQEAPTHKWWEYLLLLIAILFFGAVGGYFAGRPGGISRW